MLINKNKKQEKYVSALSKIQYIDLYHFDEIISKYTPESKFNLFYNVYKN